jgi:hypothetical protein
MQINIFIVLAPPLSLILHPPLAVLYPVSNIPICLGYSLIHIRAVLRILDMYLSGYGIHISDTYGLN